MTFTTERVPGQEPPSDVPSPKPPRRQASTARIALGWGALIAAVAAVAALTVAVFTTNDEPAVTTYAGSTDGYTPRLRSVPEAWSPEGRAPYKARMQSVPEAWSPEGRIVADADPSGRSA